MAEGDMAEQGLVEQDMADGGVAVSSVADEGVAGSSAADQNIGDPSVADEVDAGPSVADQSVAGPSVTDKGEAGPNVAYQDMAEQDMAEHGTPEKDTTGCDTTEEGTTADVPSGQDAAEKDASEEHATEKDASEEDASEEDTSEEDTSEEDATEDVEAPPPPLIILAVNAGSSSLKVSIFQKQHGIQKMRKLGECQISNIASASAKLVYTRHDHDLVVKEEDVEADKVSNHMAAFDLVLHTFTGNLWQRAIKSPKKITHIVHRIVHGGTLSSPRTLDSDLLHELESLSDLAPLHNVPALSLAQEAHRRVPKARNMVAFDSSFHATIKPHIATYPIDQEIAKSKGLRKYGFHGLSYAFITKLAAKNLWRLELDVGLIILHLGSGASVCAIRNGKSVDTSMELTPASGLPGATRAGSIDPAAVFHYTKAAGQMACQSPDKVHVTEAEHILNTQAGWKALTGTSDFGEITAKMPPRNQYQPKNPEMRLAYDIFVDRILNYVGAYWLKLGGRVDAVVFAGGIGEKSADLRRSVTYALTPFGVELDDDKNNKLGNRQVENIAAKESTCAVLVVKTDEQLHMAQIVAGQVENEREKEAKEKEKVKAAKEREREEEAKKKASEKEAEEEKAKGKGKEKVGEEEVGEEEVGEEKSSEEKSSDEEAKGQGKEKLSEEKLSEEAAEEKETEETESKEKEKGKEKVSEEKSSEEEVEGQGKEKVAETEAEKEVEE